MIFMATNDSNTNSAINYNYWADFWYYDVGVDVFSANTKEKKTCENWSQLYDKSLPQELHEQRKKNREYNNGIALLPGRIPRGLFKGKYLVVRVIPVVEICHTIETNFHRFSFLWYLQKKHLLQRHSTRNQPNNCN